MSQELTADEFNLLDVMRITGRETMHSAVLAWLLARSIGGPGIAGTHSQGALGFQLFIAQLSGFGLSPCYADQAYWVRTEVSGDTSRIDIEIACRGQFIIHIENKIWSGEGASQTSREWNDLNTRANELGIPDGRRHAIFLTPRGISATDGHFHPLSWSRVAGVFDGFSRHAKPEDVRLFCRHYAAALRRSIVQLDELKEIDDGKAAIQRD